MRVNCTKERNFNLRSGLMSDYRLREIQADPATRANNLQITEKVKTCSRSDNLGLYLCYIHSWLDLQWKISHNFSWHPCVQCTRTAFDQLLDT
jgi:hypothetical protein